VSAQVLPGQGLQKRVKLPDHDRGGTGRLRSLLTGDSMEPQGPGRMLVRGVRLETYAYNDGQRIVDLIIEAPECLFDARTRIASSSGPMTATRAGGDLSLKGVGFEWQQQTLRLVVHNDVRTILKQRLSIEREEVE
ncbi:uncharacterized protein METZ01_LOCUS444824, partial [marine metagenome]